MDVALCRLLDQSGDLEGLRNFAAGPSACEEADIREILQKHHLYSALANFYLQKQCPRKALDIWKK